MRQSEELLRKASGAPSTDDSILMLVVRAAERANAACSEGYLGCVCVRVGAA